MNIKISLVLNILLCFSFGSLKAQEYLNKDQNIVRFDFGNSNSDGLWIKKKFTDYEKSSKSKVDSQHFGLTWIHGLGNMFTLKVKGSYVQSESDNPLVGSAKRIAGLGDLGTSISKKFDFENLQEFGLSVFSGFRAPGNQEKSGGKFLAISDGKSKYDFGLNLNYLLFSRIIPSLTSVYTVRQGSSAYNQIENTFNLGYMASDKIYLNLFFSNLQTLDGKGIGDTDYEFGSVDEDHSGYGASFSYSVNSNWTTDVTFYKREYGQNTDRNQAYNAGISYLF